MKMIDENYLICYLLQFLYVFIYYLFSKIWCLERRLIAFSGSVCKLMLCYFVQFVPDLVNHKYNISVFWIKFTGFQYSCSVPLFYRVSNVALEYRSCLSSWETLSWQLTPESPFQEFSFTILPLRTKEMGVLHFVQNFLFVLLAYMELAATYLTFANFFCIRIQSFRQNLFTATYSW